MGNSTKADTLDGYIRNIENQEIKGLLLKLKNETRKGDVSWETLKKILSSIEQKNADSAREIFSLLIHDSG